MKVRRKGGKGVRKGSWEMPEERQKVRGRKGRRLAGVRHLPQE